MLRVRYLEAPIRADLRRKMVFLAGPRQVGKTTLARALLAGEPAGVYLSWDRREDRAEIRAARWPGRDGLVVLDELHKLRHWKRWIKGEFDHHRERVRFLVTGSARLDLYRRGSDSLQGRYHHYRLHPFSLSEVERGAPAEIPVPHEEPQVLGRGSPRTLDDLLRYGGFPEPFIAQSTRVHRRWQKERLERFFREDVRDLTLVRDLSSMQVLSELLSVRVASPLSVNSLREDLEVSHKALTHWLDVLERLYFTFRVRPFVGKTTRGLRKMPKLYLWDASAIDEPGARFENAVALHLLKFCHFLEDTEGYRAELHYLRDIDGREVDFLVTVGRKPWFAVECKLSATTVDSSLHHFRKRLAIPWVYQLTLTGSRDFIEDGVRCLPAARLLGALV